MELAKEEQLFLADMSLCNMCLKSHLCLRGFRHIAHEEYFRWVKESIISCIVMFVLWV